MIGVLWGAVVISFASTLLVFGHGALMHLTLRGVKINVLKQYVNMTKMHPFSKQIKMEKTYQDALVLLDSRRRIYSQRWRNEKAQSTGGPVGRPALEGMEDWVEQLGYSGNNLAVVHVAGTKGKGTTCALVSQFLQYHGAAAGLPKKVGLYTSPPLISVRERIQINATPVSEKMFTEGTFEVWDRLCAFISKDKDRINKMPRYRQFLMLVSLHIFIKEGVDVAVYETHSGGEYDCTNVLKPAVTGITTIGMDHVRALGPTIEDIAWHKAGIFKTGAAAYSTKQLPEVEKVLMRRADEKGVDLQFVGVDSTIPSGDSLVKPEVLRINASLAIPLANMSLRKAYSNDDIRLSEADICEGWNHFTWQGRFQHIDEGQCQWFLDIAHNEISLKVAARWYSQAAISSLQGPTKSPIRVVIFSQKSARNMTSLLRSMIESFKESCLQMQYVIFVSSTERRDGTITIDFHDKNQPTVSEHDQRMCAQIWQEFDSSAKILLEPTIEDAIDRARSFSDSDTAVQTFITGHSRLVGPALTLLTPNR